ncbi:MAG: hypothetical protein P4M08_06225 [Oligoflexia bacterium]|nr:hypothetical protein [Oligoflexia bacterium]
MRFVCGLIMVTALSALPALASEYPRERNAFYRQNLDFVNQALEKRKKKLTQLTADLVEYGANPVESIMGRSYRIGEEWDVVSYYNLQNASALPGGSARTDFAPHGRISAFHYRVSSIAPLRIEVTETKKTDPSVTSVTLAFDAEFHEIAKAYHRTDGSTTEGLVHGMHTRFLPLEIYEIDAPQVSTAESVPYQTPDELIASMPAPLAAIAHSSRFSYDADNASSMRTIDGFGREVDFVWQKGNPWPSYVKTDRGISILTNGAGHDH